MLRPLLPVLLLVPLPVELLPVLPELPLDVSLPLEPLVPELPVLPLVPLLMLPVDPLPLVPDDVSALPVPLLDGEELLPEPEEAEPVPLDEPDEPDVLLSLGSTTVVVVVTVFALGSLDGAVELLDAASLGLVVVVVVVPWPNAAPAVPIRERRIARGNFRIRAPVGLNVEGVFCECANLLDAFFVTGSHLLNWQQNVMQLAESDAGIVLNRRPSPCIRLLIRKRPGEAPGLEPSCISIFYILHLQHEAPAALTVANPTENRRST